MSALPRPDLPAGAQRELVDALHDLHERNGWPSLRVLARAAGCSHTTVSAAFSTPRLPSWGLLELLVEAMDGDVGEFRRLWAAAGASGAGGSGGRGPAAVGIAGRRPELTALRRHLRQGSGLLMVTGEAGLGKTRLVTAATSLESEAIFVAVGSCLPLSVDVPLLPLTDLLRSTFDRDDGEWLTTALADCAPYVAGSVQRLLPELETRIDSVPGAEDDWSRQRLFGAIPATLKALASQRPLAVLLEDLHWADSTTLDLVEHLLSCDVAVPLVGTWRLDDVATPDQVATWWERLRRLATVRTLPLQPLSPDETAEQLEQLTGRSVSPALCDRIYQRSEGQPLFTEQLARQPEDEPMPPLLADLLDHRIDGLGREAWRVARALGVADRALDGDLLTDVTGLDGADLAVGLHELDDRHLLRPSSDHRIELGHPLEAEAVRRRLVVPELIAEHRRVAEGLGRSSDPSAAEVAEHWQRAEDRSAEIGWRIRAARQAEVRFALVQAGAQWRRALALWPDDEPAIGSPPLSRHGAYLAAMSALESVDLVAAWELAEEALARLTDATDSEAAETYGRAAGIKGWLDQPEEGLVLVDRAISLYESIGPSAGYVRALIERSQLLDGLGRGDTRAALARALAVSREIDEPRLVRDILIHQAECDAGDGDLDRALGDLAAVDLVELNSPDPRGDIHRAISHTAILLTVGRVGEEVVQAGRPGLESAEAWGLETMFTSILRANMAVALRYAGQTRRAAELIDPVVVDRPPTYEDAPVQAERACLDMLRGRCAEARNRYDAVSGVPRAILGNQLENAEHGGTVDLWCGRPRVALDRLVGVLHEAMPTEVAAGTAAALALAVRAAADLADSESRSTQERSALLATLQHLLGGAQVDPFAPSASFPTRDAHRALWTAESLRLLNRSSLEHWTSAAESWDRLGRPHDAAYCRWRGAQVALSSGRGTIALRLLRRAGTDAHEHAPLTSAIADSVARAGAG